LQDGNHRGGSHATRMHVVGGGNLGDAEHNLCSARRNAIASPDLWALIGIPRATAVSETQLVPGSFFKGLILGQFAISKTAQLAKGEREFRFFRRNCCHIGPFLSAGSA
jgi:hypothetical protein